VHALGRPAARLMTRSGAFREQRNHDFGCSSASRQPGAALLPISHRLRTVRRSGWELAIAVRRGPRSSLGCAPARRWRGCPSRIDGRALVSARRPTGQRRTAYRRFWLPRPGLPPRRPATRSRSSESSGRDYSADDARGVHVLRSSSVRAPSSRRWTATGIWTRSRTFSAPDAVWDISGVGLGIYEGGQTEYTTIGIGFRQSGGAWEVMNGVRARSA
jgi:hypothetical protein